MGKVKDPLLDSNQIQNPVCPSFHRCALQQFLPSRTLRSNRVGRSLGIMGDPPKEEWSWSDSDGEDGAPQRGVPRRRPGPSATPTPSTGNTGQRTLSSTPAAESARISSSGISQQQRPESTASPMAPRVLRSPSPAVGGMRAAVQSMVGQGLCTPQQADMFLRAAASENGAPVGEGVQGEGRLIATERKLREAEQAQLVLQAEVLRLSLNPPGGAAPGSGGGVTGTPNPKP